jgi:hypothetical protein
MSLCVSFLATFKPTPSKLCYFKFLIIAIEIMAYVLEALNFSGDE